MKIKIRNSLEFQNSLEVIKRNKSENHLKPVKKDIKFSQINKLTKTPKDISRQLIFLSLERFKLLKKTDFKQKAQIQACLSPLKMPCKSKQSHNRDFSIVGCPLDLTDIALSNITPKNCPDNSTYKPNFSHLTRQMNLLNTHTPSSINNKSVSNFALKKAFPNRPSLHDQTTMPYILELENERLIQKTTNFNDYYVSNKFKRTTLIKITPIKNKIPDLKDTSIFDESLLEKKPADLIVPSHFDKKKVCFTNSPQKTTGKSLSVFIKEINSPKKSPLHNQNRKPKNLKLRMTLDPYSPHYNDASSSLLAVTIKPRKFGSLIRTIDWQPLNRSFIERQSQNIGSYFRVSEIIKDKLTVFVAKVVNDLNDKKIIDNFEAQKKVISFAVDTDLLNECFLKGGSNSSNDCDLDDSKKTSKVQYQTEWIDKIDGFLNEDWSLGDFEIDNYFWRKNDDFSLLLESLWTKTELTAVALKLLNNVVREIQTDHLYLDSNHLNS